MKVPQKAAIHAGLGQDSQPTILGESKALMHGL